MRLHISFSLYQVKVRRKCSIAGRFLENIYNVNVLEKFCKYLFYEFILN